jgi:DNA-nicking Smr family endonuclease
MVEIDLHGFKHSEVEDKLANWVILQYNEGNFPLRIITGNSKKMKNIVHRVSERYNFTTGEPLDSNPGVLIIRS